MTKPSQGICNAMQKLKIIDLFSGIGGISLGLERTGYFSTLAFCEIDRFCKMVLHRRWPGIRVESDVNDLGRMKWNGSRAQTLLRQAFRVRTYHTQERVPDFQESVLVLDGGRRVEPFAWYDHSTRCWRTWQRCLIEGWEPYSAAWPRSGMTRNGIAYQLQPLALPTSGIGSGLWHTPRANDAEKRGSLKPDPRSGLPMQVQHAHLWPTPRAQSANSPAPSRVGHRMDLQTAVQRFPTPRASEYKDSGPVGSKSHSHMLSKDYLCAVVKEPEKPSGKLNPTWVEWLQGYQTGWTEVD